MALEGVTKYGLAEAVKATLQGKLGHAFFPSAPELRIQCDAAMRPIKDEMARLERIRIEKEREAEFKPIQHSQAEIVKVQGIYQRFCEGFETDFKTEDQLVAEIRAKYDPALLDMVPDAPTAFRGPRS